MNEYQRIYKNCQATALFRLMAEVVERGLPLAKGRDRFLAAGSDFSGGLEEIQKRGDHFDLLFDVKQIAKIIEDDYVAQFGPRMVTTGSAKARIGCRHILTLNFDRPDKHRGTFKLIEDDDAKWHETALAEAATTYRRCCGWDFAPGEAGVWLCYYLPTEGSGGEAGAWHWWGNVAGFVILHDRDNDGAYEALGHIWTAAAARRRGVASKLIRHARKHFPVRHVEGPFTADSRALFKKVWPQEPAKSPA